MTKANSIVKKETKYIAYFSAILSVLMQSVFLLIGKWNYTVLLGNVLSLAVGVLNFYCMGISVQKAVDMEQADAARLMRASQSIRNVAVFAIVAAGVLMPWFNTVAVILPIFFTRAAVAFRPLIKEKEKKEVTEK